MSYAFDTMMRAWNQFIRPLVKEKYGEALVMDFEMLIEEMHDANHNVPSADGVFKGDGVNKAPGVGRAARELEETIKQLEGRRES